jgi:hypothetical protein
VKNIFAALLVSTGLAACGGGGIPQHGLLGAYAKAYETAVAPKIKPLDLSGNSDRDYATANEELANFSQAFFKDVSKGVFPPSDAPCIFKNTSSVGYPEFQCWQIVGDYALIIRGWGSNSESFKDIATGRKLYDYDTVLLSVTSDSQSYSTCVVTDNKIDTRLVQYWSPGFAAAGGIGACDMVSGNVDEKLVSKLKGVKVAIFLNKVAFKSARLACSEKDCVEEELSKLQRG